MFIVADLVSLNVSINDEAFVLYKYIRYSKTNTNKSVLLSHLVFLVKKRKQKKKLWPNKFITYEPHHKIIVLRKPTKTKTFVYFLIITTIPQTKYER